MEKALPDFSEPGPKAVLEMQGLPKGAFRRC